MRIDDKSRWICKVIQQKNSEEDVCNVKKTIGIMTDKEVLDKEMLELLIDKMVIDDKKNLEIYYKYELPYQSNAEIRQQVEQIRQN